MTLLGAEYSVVDTTTNNALDSSIVYSLKVGKVEVFTEMPTSKINRMPTSEIHVMADRIDRLIFMRIFGVPEEQQDKLNRLLLQKLNAADER